MKIRKRAATDGESDVWESPLDRPLAWTEFPDWYATSKKQHRSSLRELAKRIPRIRGATKNHLPWLKLARFGDEVKSERTGCLRHSANMVSVSGIELDFDKGDPTWDQAWARLWEAGIPALFYTTRRHSSQTHRFRILLPLSRMLPPSERARMAARAYGIVRGAIDGASFVAPQSYYFGSVGGVRVIVELVDPPSGRFIDLANDLDAGALNKRGEPWEAWEAEPGNDNDDDDDIGALDHVPDIERIRRDLSIIPSEERATWLLAGQAINHEFDGDEVGYELWDSWSQSSDKYDEDDQRRVWESFGSFAGKPVTIATVHALAKKHKPATFGELTFETPAQCAAAPLRGYIWKHMLAPSDIASIFGPPGAGKSTIAPHIGYMTSLGDTAFGMRTKPGIVFYVAAEDATGLRQRVRALMLRHDDAPNFRVVGGVSNLFDEDSADLDALTEAVADQLPQLIIIDTLAMAFPGLEENDAKSMGRVVAVARQLAEHEAAVVLIHHDTKAEGSTPRGHSLLNGALDMAMHLRRGEDGIIRGKLTKNRNGSPDRDIAFRIGTEMLGTDEDGDSITAPLVEEVTGSDAARPKRLPPSQREALAILEELEGQGAVANEDWADVCTDGFRVSQSETRKLRRDAFSRARRSLIQAGLIVIDANSNVRSKSAWDDEVTSDEYDD